MGVYKCMVWESSEIELDEVDLEILSIFINSNIYKGLLLTEIIRNIKHVLGVSIDLSRINRLIRSGLIASYQIENKLNIDSNSELFINPFALFAILKIKNPENNREDLISLALEPFTSKEFDAKNELYKMFLYSPLPLFFYEFFSQDFESEVKRANTTRHREKLPVGTIEERNEIFLNALKNEFLNFEPIQIYQ